MLAAEMSQVDPCHMNNKLATTIKQEQEKMNILQILKNQMKQTNKNF